MTHFEYLSVAASIIFALSVGRLTVALPYIFVSQRFDWLQAGYFVGLFFLQMLLWWRMWSFSSVETWNFLSFILFLASPLLYFLASFTLVTEDPKSVQSWRTQFEGAYRWFFGALATSWAIGYFGVLYILKFQINPTFFILTIAIFASGAAFNRRWVHSVVLVWLWFIFLSIAAQEFYDSRNT